MARSPFREGFHAAWHRPAAVAAEVAWRWTFGAAALALATAALLVYLSTLAVSRVEVLALRSHTPWLIGDAIAHILRGSGPQLLRIVLVLTPALTVLWIATASLGRAATLRQLLRASAGPALSSLVQLNVLRAALYVGSLAAYAGAAILAGHAANRGFETRPGVFLAVFLALALAITLARSRANWFPFLATIYAVKDGAGPGDALRRSASLFTRRARQFVAVGSALGLLHLVVGGVATLMSLAVLGLIGYVRWELIAALLVWISLAYFVVSDFLYIVRLAAYITIAEDDDGWPEAPPLPAAPEAPLTVEALQ